jgi:hypothetical protein
MPFVAENGHKSLKIVIKALTPDPRTIMLVCIMLGKCSPIVQLRTGLPDVLFSYPKSQFGYIFEGLGLENVGVFYDHGLYFMASLVYAVCVSLVYSSYFGMLDQEKSGNPV